MISDRSSLLKKAKTLELQADAYADEVEKATNAEDRIKKLQLSIKEYKAALAIREKIKQKEGFSRDNSFKNTLAIRQSIIFCYENIIKSTNDLNVAKDENINDPKFLQKKQKRKQLAKGIIETIEPIRWSMMEDEFDQFDLFDLGYELFIVYRLLEKKAIAYTEACKLKDLFPELVEFHQHDKAKNKDYINKYLADIKEVEKFIAEYDKEIALQIPAEPEFVFKKKKKKSNAEQNSSVSQIKILREYTQVECNAIDLAPIARLIKLAEITDDEGLHSVIRLTKQGLSKSLDRFNEKFISIRSQTAFPLAEIKKLLPFSGENFLNAMQCIYGSPKDYHKGLALLFDVAIEAINRCRKNQKLEVKYFAITMTYYLNDLIMYLCDEKRKEIAKKVKIQDDPVTSMYIEDQLLMDALAFAKKTRPDLEQELTIHENHLEKSHFKRLIPREDKEEKKAPHLYQQLMTASTVTPAQIHHYYHGIVMLQLDKNQLTRYKDNLSTLLFPPENKKKFSLSEIDKLSIASQSLFSRTAKSNNNDDAIAEKKSNPASRKRKR